MFSSVIYLELFIALFFLPGFFLAVMLGIKKFRFLLSFALSYSLLVLTLLPFEYYAQPVVRWQWCVLLEWVMLAVLAVTKTLMYGNFNLVGAPLVGDRLKTCPQWLRHKRCRRVGTRKRGPYIFHSLLNPRLIIPLLLAGIACGYVAYAGPYLEIPSDAWTHVYRFQFQKLCVIDSGLFPSGLSWDGLFLQHTFCYWYFNPWYFIHAWVCHLSGLPIMDSLLVLTFVNIAVFLLGFYYFGLFIFAGLRISPFKKMVMAALASLFAAATMGNMVFAYIRYYAFAPTVLNYVLLLAAMVFILVWMRSNKWLGHALWIAPVLLIATNTIHTQETLFIFFMTLALSIWETIGIIWRKFTTAGRSVYDSRCSVRDWKTVILTAFLLIVFFAGFAAIRHFKPGSWVSPYMIMPHVHLPSEPVNFIFRNLTISLPQNPYLRLVVYQLFVFYQIVGCWGLFIYLLFALMARHFVKIPYLIAGMMIVPFLTVFNPCLVDLIVRIKQGAALYRFIYMIPLPFVGAYLFVHFWERTRSWFFRLCAGQGAPLRRTWPRLSWINFAGCILVLAGLIGFVFPINAAGIYAPYSKIYTLRKIPAGNDYRLWHDLGKFMEKHENKIILMDSLTRFMSPYFPKNNCIYSTWLNSQNPEKYQPEPYTWESLRGRGIIIVNYRDGGPSITGKIAKHWPEDVLRVSRYYSPEVQVWLESHPETFRKIWEQNRIAVYAVR